MLENLKYINLLLEEKNQIINECIECLKESHPTRTNQYEKCYRDLTHIYNSIVSDLQYNTISYTKQTANKFWFDNKRQIQSYDVEFFIYDLLKLKMKEIYNTDHLDEIFKFLKYIIENGPTETVEQSLTEAAIVSQHCQRNWDYNYTIPERDISTLIEVATSMPTKQNLNFYKLIISTDREFNSTCFEYARDPSNKDTHTRNTQVDAPLLLLWCWDFSAKTSNNDLAVPDKSILLNFEKSIMISLGATVLAAAQLGYKTGFCQCVEETKINKLLRKKFNTKLEFSGTFLGIGKENPKADNWYDVLNHKDKLKRVVHPEIRKDVEIYRL